MRSEQEYSQAVEEAKDQIERDIVSRWAGLGRPRTFQELHSKADANEYAGFCGPVIEGWPDRSDWEISDVAVVQDRLDVWLQETAPPEHWCFLCGDLIEFNEVLMHGDYAHEACRDESEYAGREENVTVEYHAEMGFARVVLTITEDGAYTQHSLTFSLEAFEDLRKLVDLATSQEG
jgi:hypothetical protein